MRIVRVRKWLVEIQMDTWRGRAGALVLDVCLPVLNRLVGPWR